MSLISREAAIKHLYGRLIESANNNVGVWEDAGIVFEDIATERLKNWVYEIPTAERVGKWIEVKNKWGGLGIICSECGAQVPRDGWGSAMQSAYCYRCGARMKGEEDDSM